MLKFTRKHESEDGTSIIYENQWYKVFYVFMPSGQLEKINVLSKQPKYPDLVIRVVDGVIDSKYVSVSASGYLDTDELKEHMEKLQICASILEEIESKKFITQLSHS